MPLNQDAWSYVSCQERSTAHKSVCYLQEPLSHRFQHLIYISITARSISIKFMHFMSSIYTTWHTKFEENQLRSFWNMHMRCWKLPNFSLYFSSLHWLKIIIWARKTTFSWINFFQIWNTNKGHSSLSSLKFWRCSSWI